jgi:hypothetical protein
MGGALLGSAGVCSFGPSAGAVCLTVADTRQRCGGDGVDGRAPPPHWDVHHVCTTSGGVEALTIIDEALSANATIANDYEAGRGKPPAPRIAIVTCADPRLTDIVRMLGLTD